MLTIERVLGFDNRTVFVADHLADQNPTCVITSRPLHQLLSVAGRSQEMSTASCGAWVLVAVRGRAVGQVIPVRSIIRGIQDT